MSNVRKIIAVIVGVALIFGASLFLLPTLIENNPFSGNSTNGENPNPVNPFETLGLWSVGEKRNEETSVQGKPSGSIAISGTDRYTVSSMKKYIELTNPESNQVNFVFTITDAETGEVIAKTGAVPPGQYAYIENVYDHYSKAGTYNVIIGISTFSFDGQQKNGANLKAVVTVL